MCDPPCVVKSAVTSPKIMIFHVTYVLFPLRTYDILYGYGPMFLCMINVTLDFCTIINSNVISDIIYIFECFYY